MNSTSAAPIFLRSSTIFYVSIALPLSIFPEADALDHFSNLRSPDHVRLIHTASNQVLLKDVPYLPYLDLSIVFFHFLELQ